MNKIYKYPVPPTGKQILNMPVGAIILTVQIQDGVPWIWAIINTRVEHEERTFYTFGTGHTLPDFIGELKYIGTYQMQDGAFVGHLFEKPITNP